MPAVMSFPTRIVHGRGAIRALGSELERIGARRLLLVTDKGIVKAGLLKSITPLLEQAGMPFAVFSDFDPNPTDADALRGIEAYRSAGADAILALGGGASLDMGKAIRLLVHHDPPLSRYDDAKGGDQFVTARQPPLVAVPTTAGTGSEVGRSTVLIIDGTKVVIFSPHLLANAAILDPELTVGLPPFVTAATGMDALTHNLEAYVAKGDHPLADAIALDGLRRIALHLLRAVKNGTDLEAREQMLLGSAMGAIAFQKGLGACHSVAHALTPVAGTHHGLANSLMLPTVIEFNRSAAEERLATAASRSELERLAAREPIDLARAALAIAHEEYPDLDEGRYLRTLDEFAAQVMRGLPAGALPERRVGRLTSVLFHELGFSGNEADYYDPRNSFLNEVIERRTGIPISLSVLYMEVGRRCGLRADGVLFPGHFLCKVTLDEGELIVDPFHRGQILGLPELKRRLAAAMGEDARLDRRLLRPARPREILSRMLQNLRSIYLNKRDLPRALSCVDRLLLFVPDDARVLRDRARLYEMLGGAQAAAADLERVLGLDPNASDAATLRARLSRLRGSAGLLN